MAKKTKKTNIQNTNNEIKPFFSVLLIIFFIFSIVFIKMELRRAGYLLFKEKNKLKSYRDTYQFKKIEYAKRMRPERLRYLALTRLTMGEAKKGQIIQLTGEKIVVPQ